MNERIKQMKQVTQFISKYLALFLVLMGIGTYLSPIYLDVKSWVPSLLLGFVIFCTGLSMDVSSVKKIHTKKKELVFITGFKWVITVIISVLLAHLFFSNKAEIAAGFILTGAVPSATAATLYTFLSGGNTSLVVAASLLDVFISPIVAPLAMMGLSTEEVSISLLSLLQSFTIIVLIPLFLGVMIQRQFPNVVSQSVSLTKLGSSLSLLLLIHTLVGSGKETISENLHLLPMLIGLTFVQIWMPMFLSYFIARRLNFSEEDARATFFQVGLCNSALAAILAFEFIGSLAAFAPIINLVINLSSGAFFANIFAKKEIDRKQNVGINY